MNKKWKCKQNHINIKVEANVAEMLRRAIRLAVGENTWDDIDNGMGNELELFKLGLWTINENE